MSSIQHIYNEIFSGKQLSVRCDSRTEFETLRTSLCKKNSVCVALDMTNESVIARYNEEKKIGTFSLGKSKRAAASFKWEIVEESGGDDEQNTPETP
jgi:hypothetical protein